MRDYIVILIFSFTIYSGITYSQSATNYTFSIKAKENESPENDDIVLWFLNPDDEKFVFKIRPVKDEKLLFFIEHEKFQFVYNVNYLGE